MSYSLELRERVVSFVEKGNSRKSASEVFSVHYNTVKAWVKQFRERGCLTPKPMPPRPPYKLEVAVLQQQVKEHPDWFQHEQAESFGVTPSAISKAFAKMGLTRKKPFLYKEQNEEAKQKFLTALKKVTATSGVYLEEGGIRQDSLREFGWAPCGEPSGGRRTGTRQRRLNLIAALHDHTVKAPLIYEGVMHPELFNTYLREQLLPQLMPGALLIMDKASFHKSTATSNLIKEKGVQLWFLPPYSPELNPIERVWSVLKRYVRWFRAHFDSLFETLTFIFQKVNRFQEIQN